MRFPDKKYPHSDLTRQIIGCAMEVHNTLSNGLTEKIYENSLCLELATSQLFFSQQLEYPVHYKAHFVGKLIPDLVVDNKVVVDTKVVEEFNSTHTAQILIISISLAFK